MKKFVKNFVKKFLFSVSEIEHRNKDGKKKYRLYNILGIKIKLNLLYWNLSSNKIYKLDKNGCKRLISSRKELKDFDGIQIEGENNELVLYEDTALLHFNARIIGNNNYVEIKSVKDLTTIDLLVGGNFSELRIGNIIYFANARIKLGGDNIKISIGDDCLFAHEIEIWSMDAHKIYDLVSQKLINPSQDITIGNHVWIGRHASINKGAVIPDGCIVGASAFVNKVFSEKNCIIAGVPAKIVKQNIRWEL